MVRRILRVFCFPFIWLHIWGYLVREIWLLSSKLPPYLLYTDYAILLKRFHFRVTRLLLSFSDLKYSQIISGLIHKTHHQLHSPVSLTFSHIFYSSLWLECKNAPVALSSLIFGCFAWRMLFTNKLSWLLNNPVYFL